MLAPILERSPHIIGRLEIETIFFFIFGKRRRLNALGEQTQQPQALWKRKMQGLRNYIVHSASSPKNTIAGLWRGLVFGVAAGDGSRTHQATPLDAPLPVLKTGASTGMATPAEAQVT